MDCLKDGNGIAFVESEGQVVGIVRGGKAGSGREVQCGPLGVVQVVKEMRGGRGGSRKKRGGSR